jgi:deazaflavin-dependent oxidoreductase (nitroreductase family)
MALPQWLARFNCRATNRLTRTFAGELPGFAIVVHTGRRSGRTYRTPVNAFRDGNDYIIALTYGPETDWVRNVRAAGGCGLLTRGRRIRLTNPRIFVDPSRRWAPLPVRLVLGLIGASQYMRLTHAPARTVNQANEASAPGERSPIT